MKNKKLKIIIVGLLFVFVFSIGFVSNYFWEKVGTDFMVLSYEE